MIVCQNCLHENREGTSFCEECGEPLRPSASKHRATGRPAPQAPAQPPAGRAGTPRRGATPPEGDDAGPILPPPALPLAPPSGSGAGSGAPLGTLRLRLNSGKSFELKGKSSYLIGRRDDERGIFPELDLGDSGGLESGVSRAHAIIHVTPSGYMIEDLESTNETLLNLYRLLPRQQYPLNDGDQLRLGILTMLVIIS